VGVRDVEGVGHGALDGRGVSVWVSGVKKGCDAGLFAVGLEDLKI